MRCNARTWWVGVFLLLVGGSAKITGQDFVALEFTTSLVDTNQLSPIEFPYRARFWLTGATLTYAFEIAPSDQRSGI